MLKAQRKQAKAVKGYLETGDDLIAAYEAFEHHADSEELGKLASVQLQFLIPLAELLQVASNFEVFHQKLLYGVVRVLLVQWFDTCYRCKTTQR